MVTLKADNRRRIQLPDAKPGQIFAYTPNGDGTVTLTLVKAEREEPFPEGSLKRFAAERDEEFEAFVQKTELGVFPGEDA